MKNLTAWQRILFPNLLILLVFVIINTMISFNANEIASSPEQAAGISFFLMSLGLAVANLGIGIICLLLHLVQHLRGNDQKHCLKLFGIFFLVAVLVAILAVPGCFLVPELLNLNQ